MAIIFYSRAEKWLKTHKFGLAISHSESPSDDIVFIHNCYHLAHELVHNRTVPDDDYIGDVHNKLFANKHTKVFVANSSITKEEISKRHGIPEGKFVINHPELDTDRFNINEHDKKREDGRKLLGVDSDSEVVGLITSGQFAKRNPIFFLDIVRSLVKVKPNIKAIIIGKNKEYEKILYRAAVERGIADNFKIYQPFHEVEHIYHAIDVTVHPALIEEFGYVVPESILCGTPCVISDMVGAKDLLIKHNIDTILPLSCSDIWVEKVLQLLDDSAYRKAVIEQGLTLGSYSQENRKIYKKLIENIMESKYKN